MRFRVWLISGAVALLVAACEGSGGGGDGAATGDAISEELAATFDGSYRMDSWTEDAAACGPGEDQLEGTSEPWLGVGSFDFFGETVVAVISCVDAPECDSKVEALANMEGAGGIVNVKMIEHAGDGELRGFTAWTGPEEDGVCSGRRLESHTLTLADGTLTLSTEIAQLADAPSAEEGFCVLDVEAMREEARDAPCVGAREVVAERE